MAIGLPSTAAGRATYVSIQGSHGSDESGQPTRRADLSACFRQVDRIIADKLSPLIKYVDSPVKDDEDDDPTGLLVLTG